MTELPKAPSNQCLVDYILKLERRIDQLEAKAGIMPRFDSVTLLEFSRRMEDVGELLGEVAESDANLADAR